MSDPQVTKSEAPAATSVSAVEIGRRSGAADKPNRRLEMVPPDRLVADNRNARTHSKEQIGQITRSIERFGFIAPVLIDDAGQIIAGHGRVEAAKRLGLDYVPILRITHLSATERKAYALADNRLAELAGWDGEILATELQALLELNFDIELTGFQINDIDIVWEKDEAKKLDDQGSATARGAGISGSTASPAVSHAGDLWWLGGHQLRCGDGGNADSYAAVDAAIRCWQRVTGKSAMLAGVGQNFKKVEKERARTAAPDAGRRPAATAKREAA